MVSHRSRAGWSAGMLSAWKLSSSVSTSGLSTTTNPNWPKIRAISRSVSRRGWSEPRQRGRPGRRDVLRLGGEAALERDRLEARAACGDGRLDRLADRVGERADPRPVLGREGADAAEQRAQLALAAEDGRLDGLQCARGCRPPRWPRARAPRSSSSCDVNEAMSTTGGALVV